MSPSHLNSWLASDEACLAYTMVRGHTGLKRGGGMRSARRARRDGKRRSWCGPDELEQACHQEPSDNRPRTAASWAHTHGRPPGRRRNSSVRGDHDTRFARASVARGRLYHWEGCGQVSLASALSSGRPCHILPDDRLKPAETRASTMRKKTYVRERLREHIGGVQRCKRRNMAATGELGARPGYEAPSCPGRGTHTLTGRRRVGCVRWSPYVCEP